METTRLWERAESGGRRELLCGSNGDALCADGAILLRLSAGSCRLPRPHLLIGIIVRHPAPRCDVDHTFRPLPCKSCHIRVPDASPPRTSGQYGFRIAMAA